MSQRASYSRGNKIVGADKDYFVGQKKSERQLFKKNEWRDQRSSKKDLAWRQKMVFTIFLKSYQKVTS